LGVEIGDARAILLLDLEEPRLGFPFEGRRFPFDVEYDFEKSFHRSRRPVNRTGR